MQHLHKLLLDVYYDTVSIVGLQEAIKILTDSTKYQSVHGYFCFNVVHPEIV